MMTILKIIFLLGFILVFRVNVNAQPIVTWEKAYGIATIYRGIQTNNREYVAVGITRVLNNNRIYFIRLNSKGDTLWQKVIGSKQFGYGGYWVEETDDKGFIIAGSDGSGPNVDLYIVKTDSNGNVLWERSYGGNELDIAYRVFQTQDKGFIVGARTYSFGDGNQKLLLVKTDSLGNKEWQKVYGESIFFGDLILIENIGYILMGYDSGNKIFRLNLSGDTLWSIHSGSLNIGCSIRQTSDKGFIIGGNSTVLNPNKSMLTKTDSVGNIQWEREYSYIGREGFYGLEVLAHERGYFTFGTTDSNSNSLFKAFVRIIDINGNVKFVRTYSPTGIFSDYCEFRSGIVTNDGGYFLAGSFTPPSYGTSYFVKLDSSNTVNILKLNNNRVSNFILHQNFPNPFNLNTVISYQLAVNSFVKLIVFDITGREIKTLINNYKQAGNHNVTFDAVNLPSGVYYYELSSGQNTSVKRMVLIK